MMTSPGIFLIFFFEIFIFWAVGRVKGQKIVQNDKKILSVTLDISGTILHMVGKKAKKWYKMTQNSVCQASYPRNYTSYDCHLWCVCVK